MINSQWTSTGSDIFYNMGRVGLGNSVPQYTLDVIGDINYTGALRYNGTPVSLGISEITSTLPITVTPGGIGNTRHLSMLQADAINDGFLASADWNIFNDKISSQWNTIGANIFFNTGNVGIGTVEPASKLTVAGRIESTSEGYKFPDGTVQTTAWSQLGNSGWSLTGNSGTVDGTNFIGTTDNVPFNIRVNNEKAGRIDQTDGNAFFGYQSGNTNPGFSNAAFGGSTMFTNTTGNNNTAIGYTALYYNTTGARNTASGAGALKENQTANDNTANGFVSLFNNTTGFSNTGTGSYSLYMNSTGNYNTANGAGALRENTTGYQNTAVGNAALYTNTTGNQNAATGYYALFHNTDGFFNTADGSSSLAANTSGKQNTAVGASALGSNTIGNYNTAIGASALLNSVAGSYNVAIGFDALYFNAGDNNTAVGVTALNSNSQGSGNTAIGRGALYTNSNGNDNTAVGSYALANSLWAYNNTATGTSALNANYMGTNNTANGSYAIMNNLGSYNTATGSWALKVSTSGDYNSAYGYASLSQNLTGGSNTAFGYNSLSNSTSGSNNTAIGSNTNVSTGAIASSTAIGVGAVVNANNKIRLGSSFVTAIEGQVPYSFPSDGQFSKSVTEDVTGLEFIGKLRPVTYQFDTKMFDEFLMKNMPDSVRQARIQNTDYAESSGIVHTGFIAQEVEQAARECGFNFDGVNAPKDGNGNYGVAYSQFTVPLVKAVQELNQKNIMQQKRIEELEARLDKLEKSLAK
jgi:hypothetical protein